MALLEFLPASTGTRIIRLGVGKRLLELVHFFQHQEVHHLVGVTSAAQQVCHDAHGTIDVLEEKLVAGT